MIADYVVIALGLIVTTIGYLIRPAEIGWFLLGFGAAQVILGILDMIFHQPSEKVEDENS